MTTPNRQRVYIIGGIGRLGMVGNFVLAAVNTIEIINADRVMRSVELPSGIRSHMAIGEAFPYVFIMVRASRALFRLDGLPIGLSLYIIKNTMSRVATMWQRACG